MYNIEFEYYNVECGRYELDDFDVFSDYKDFLVWLDDHDIIDYKITNIEVYED